MNFKGISVEVPFFVACVTSIPIHHSAAIIVLTKVRLLVWLQTHFQTHFRAQRCENVVFDVAAATLLDAFIAFKTFTPFRIREHKTRCLTTETPCN